jgi:hypothetical protein
MKKQNKERSQHHMASKKSYDRPSVITFGSVAKLTQTKLSTSSDGQSSKGTKVMH